MRPVHRCNTSFRYEQYDNTKAGNGTNPFQAYDAISESSMRYSKTTVFTIALAVAVSTVEFSAVANAQGSPKEFPWRSKSKVKAVAQNVKSAIPTTAISTPARDLTTIETIATPTPNFEAMPAVIYDEGKTYVRQGDTYVESTDATATPAASQNYSNYVPPVPAVKKISLFQKTKDLTGRLNPFSKSLRSPTAYKSNDWKVPSFSQTLPSFSKKVDDPITFAAVVPLPAKAAVPDSFNRVPTALASRDLNKSPAAPASARDSQFKSALPTETKLTSVFSTDTKAASSFKNKVSDSEFEKKFIPAMPTEKKITAAVGNSVSGFTANGIPAATQPPVADFKVAKLPAAKLPATNLPKLDPPAAKVASAKLSSFAPPATDFQPTISSPQSDSQLSVFQGPVARPARTASLISADHEFWSPR